MGRTRSRKLALIIRISILLVVVFTYMVIGSVSNKFKSSDEDDVNLEINYGSGRHLLAINTTINCTPPAIDEFPSDGFTREQRQKGWILVHVFISFYLFILLAIVCDDFFVPAIKKVCDGLHLSEDAAGATFMAIAGSSPELFINSVGTFVTQGDIGVGTIVGSAVFNILAVPACCGLIANMVLQLDWWPLTRDSLMYGISVIMLIGILQDGKVEMHEAALLVGAYVFYIISICFNKALSNTFNRLARRCKRKRNYTAVMSETHPLLGKIEKNGNCGHIAEEGIMLKSEVTLKDCEELDEPMDVWSWPRGDPFAKQLWFLLTWPICFVLSITIPDCRKHSKLYLVTFGMCVVYIGLTSYAVAWLITTIGDTINIPDSVMGLTFLAAGTSVPEAVSSVIVTKLGHGAMGLSSSIGSNTFDILFCLGLPWLIKTAFYPKSEEDNSITINSSGITYSAVSLLSTLILLYLSFLLNRFKLDWKIGLTCLSMYICFLVFASLVELNVFFPVNLPTCNR
ncbi:hypothetical protein PPYR_08580 [Photinus pyralis]|uniref:Sodium/calcium exchanger membrane region domain-containing protein n=1 Tax=Photinus pyralis TaxID=7054 RepID=A0A1Y1MAT2_PHOPY|nr:sodium/potassium/calcium exchanger 3-like [Photinus pyralis]KAB0797587.1 hypothetical protein PPYR_08580 [Photinus pyralis]